jgi:hypothetical protein
VPVDMTFDLSIQQPDWGTPCHIDIDLPDGVHGVCTVRAYAFPVDGQSDEAVTESEAWCRSISGRHVDYDDARATLIGWGVSRDDLPTVWQLTHDI